MAEVIKERIITQRRDLNQLINSPIELTTYILLMVQYAVSFFFGALDMLLLFRFTFKILGANTASGFVSLIYGLTGGFVAPFEGIFKVTTVQGVDTTSIFEPSTMVAIIVYAILAAAIINLLELFSNRQATVV